MKDLIIIGAGGFGREVAWVVDRINAAAPTWDLLGFLDDDEDLQGAMIDCHPVLGKIADAGRYANAFFVCTVAASKVREKIIARVREILPAARFATLIDPSAVVSPLVSIGEGTIICANSVVTVNISLGDHVIVDFGCVVGHDATLRDFVTLYPSVKVSGMTTLGPCCEMGTGSQIIQFKQVGAYSIVGAGATVVKDIPEKCTAVGCPARPIKFFD